jgi:hypothetical protein
MKRKYSIIISALLFTLATLAIGYWAFGLVTMLIFTSGFLSGFIMWLLLPSKGSWESIKAPYWLALGLFILHRVEEKQLGFFNKLSLITGVPTPEILSVPVILLLILSVGAWLLIPYLVKRGNAFGYCLAWTFFAAMGITELAHFILPFFTDESYTYFPGMASVILLAPVAWCGMFRLVRNR